MKSLYKFSILTTVAVLLLSCSSVRVVTDYDQAVDFTAYRSYAFYKTGIDKAQISDLDKRRILRAIDAEMQSRGLVKSMDPDLLVTIFTTEREQVNVYNNAYWGGWGWGPGWGPGWGWGWYDPWVWGPSVSTSTEGALYIDLIDASKKELIWQGRGSGDLGNTAKVAKKEARIREFVAKIMREYPPAISQED